MSHKQAWLHKHATTNSAKEMEDELHIERYPATGLSKSFGHCLPHFYRDSVVLKQYVDELKSMSRFLSSHGIALLAIA